MLPDLLFVPVLVAYLAILLVLFAFGLNFFYLVAVAVRAKHRRPPELTPATWPVVTVQLPMYNEYYVARRLIDAAAAMHYPEGRLEIQVLDDSTDDTSQLIAEAVARWHERGVDIRHIRRGSREGYKAGALRHGLEGARGAYVAILDADVLPEP